MAGEATFTDTIGRLLSTTRSQVERMVFDVVTTRVPLIHYLMQEKRTKDGGAYLEAPVMKEVPTVIGAATTSATLAPAFLAPATKTRYAWKNIYAPFMIPGPDIRKNKGPEKQIDLFGLHLDAAAAAMVEALGGTSLGLWGSALNDESNEAVLTSLLNLVKSSDNATGTTGNLNRTNTWWRNQLNTGAAITDFSANGLDRLRAGHFAARRGNQVPDVCVTTTTTLRNLYNALQANFRYNLPQEYRLSSRRTVDVGADDIGFHGSILLDDANAEASAWRGLNTYSLYMVFDTESFMAIQPFVSMYPGEHIDGVGSMLLCMANVVCHDLARQYIVTGSDSD